MNLLFVPGFSKALEIVYFLIIYSMEWFVAVLKGRKNFANDNDHFSVGVLKTKKKVRQ